MPYPVEAAPVVLRRSGAAGLVLVVARLAMTGGVPDVWVLAGVVLLPLGVGGAYAAAVRVHADADGLSYRTLLRRRRARWEDVADVRVYVQHLRHGDTHRVEVVTRGGRVWRLPLPVGPSSEGRDTFDDTVEALRALHRRHGTPESEHLVVITGSAAGRRVGLAAWMCAMFLAGAALAAWFVPVVAETELAWTSAVPCAAESSEHDRDCLTTLSAVIARTDVRKPKEAATSTSPTGGRSTGWRCRGKGPRGSRPATVSNSPSGAVRYGRSSARSMCGASTSPPPAGSP